MKAKRSKSSGNSCAVSKGRFFPWLYYAKERDLGDRWFPTQIHKIRDGLAVVEASQIFATNGYAYGGSILNVPKEVRTFLGEKAKEDSLQLTSSDVIFIPTRPPIDEPGTTSEKKIRKTIKKGETELEAFVLKRLSSAFKRCTREEVVLADQLQLGPASPSGAEEYKSLKFKQNNGGTIVALCGTKDRPPKENNLAVGYLVSIPGTPPNPFRILASFGAGGTETLWFHLLLRTQYLTLFLKALNSPGIRVWMVPFLVPDYAPNLLTCDPARLRPSTECCDLVEWSTK